MARGRKVSQFMQESTLHGLNEISRGKNVKERVFHSVIVVISYSLTFYGFYQIFNGYMNRPIVTSILIENQEYLDLPDVTICLFNRMNKHYFEQNRISKKLAMFLEWTFLWVNPAYPFIKEYPTLREVNKTMGRDSPLVIELRNTLDRLGMTIDELIDAASFRCEDVFKQCIHDDTEFDCCNSTAAVMTEMGRCFKFPSRPQIWAGFQKGTTILLHIPYENYSVSETMLLNDGIKIKLTEKGRGYEFDAIFSPMKVHTLLQLQATSLDFMDDPPRYRCNKNVKDRYSLMTCFDGCMLKPVLQDCSCRYIASVYTSDNETEREAERKLPVCDPTDMLLCAYGKIRNKSFKQRETECRRKCKPPCKYWKYSTTVTYSRFPDQEDLIHKEDNPDIILDIFFEKLDYTLLRHLPSMTMDNFVADIGGQVGLWMGGSILSIIHLVVFLALCAGDKGQSKAKRTTRSVKRNKNPAITQTQFSSVSTFAETIEYYCANDSRRDIDNNFERCRIHGSQDSDTHL